MWYAICNNHGTLIRNLSQPKVEYISDLHAEERPNCRVGIFEIDEFNRPIIEIIDHVNSCFKRLNAHSHGQHVEVL